jgi:uncharacterized Tic20 family protein
MQTMNVPTTAPTEDERTWGMYAHLSGMLAYTAIPFGGVIGPAIIYAQTKQSRPFANAQARAALNFHITIGIFQMICFVVAIAGYIPMLATAMSDVPGTPPSVAGILIFACGMIGLSLLYIWSFVFTLVNTIRAANGALVGYPLAIPFFAR